MSHICKKCGDEFTSKSHNSTHCDNCKTIICKTCNKKFIVQPKYIKTAKYCSKECRSNGDMNYIWQDVDIKYIKTNYPFNISMKAIAEKYNTSISAVARITAKLNLPKCPIELRQKRVGDTQRVWTKSKIIEKIKEEHSKNNDINSAVFQKKHGSVHYCACKIFGSWKNAIESAGFDYNDISLYAYRITWSKKMIISKIKKLYNNDVDLMASNIRDNFGDLFNAVRRCNGIETWENAVKLAGFDYNEICGDQWGTKYVGLDNNVYMSIKEGQVADELFKLLKNNYINAYKTQVKVTKNRRWTCDFVIDHNNIKIWIEVDGLGDSRKGGSYNDGHEKIQYYKNNKFNFKIVTSYNELKKWFHSKCELIQPKG